MFPIISKIYEDVVVKIPRSVTNTVNNVVAKWHQVVEIHNESSHPAHVWCQDANEKIGGDEGLKIPPGEKITFGFYVWFSTLYWCNMEWNGQRVKWDVYVAAWDDGVPNPAKWTIKDDGVYAQWNSNRKVSL